ncbi:hypothetical protein ACQR2D_16425 [Bradyrhizobium sp. HKCCYLRH2057]
MRGDKHEFRKNESKKCGRTIIHADFIDRIEKKLAERLGATRLQTATNKLNNSSARRRHE